MQVACCAFHRILKDPNSPTPKRTQTRTKRVAVRSTACAWRRDSIFRMTGARYYIKYRKRKVRSGKRRREKKGKGKEDTGASRHIARLHYNTPESSLRAGWLLIRDLCHNTLCPHQSLQNYGANQFMSCHAALDTQRPNCWISARLLGFVVTAIGRHVARAGTYIALAAPVRKVGRFQHRDKIKKCTLANCTDATTHGRASPHRMGPPKMRADLPACTLV